MILPVGIQNILRPLRHRDFRIYMLGQFLSQIAVWMQRLTIGWLTWELTRSATWLGVMGLADLVPTLFVGTLSGVLADRVEKLRIIWFTQIGLALTSLALFVVVAEGLITIQLLFALAVVLSVCTALNLPARLAIVPSLLDKDHLHGGIAMNSVISNNGRFLGPALAGFVIAQYGTAAAFAACAILFGIPVLTLLLISVREAASVPSGKRVLAEVAEGISYTARHPGIGPLMVSLVITSTLAKAIVTIFPAFASDVFHRGADGLAWLTAVLGAGAVAGGFYMAQRSSSRGLTKIFVSNLAFIGIGLVAFASTDLFWFAVAMSGFLGVSQIINAISAQTLIQQSAESHVRGRVLSVYVIIQRGGQSLGGFVLGVLADVIGIRWSVAAGGAVCLVFWLWSLRRMGTMTKTLER